MLVHVVSDATDREGGHVTARLRALGADLVDLDRDGLPEPAEWVPGDLLLLLGSERSAHDPAHVHPVVAESRLVRASLAAGVPVMGICYGAQLIARALGGTSWAMDAPELGWQRIDTLDDELCPRGPWGQFHHDTFAPPQTARVLGSTWHGPQCFVDETRGARVIAWQFHPEVTPETYARWVEDSAAKVRAAGVDPAALVRQAKEFEHTSRTAATALVDAALRYLTVH
ncbi:class I glutamine amidotransferase [Aeromicrobium marinum DSM 15272]|uniref:Class I glutamine amidotransferase n=1 Tax=Aeromicrobium marinum DSM 15272 TaxID=585531 RepID=E2S912_9ACTN|nr:gamma-glutamyl-gamma-aminobutyrate hydrolase family protein [Aeromicrobium marinum]EFQ84282.1 class I glutamine amidotransferase [Aeromicrobium marinum DSM 15272]